MRISCSLGSLLSIGEVVSCAQSISNTKAETVWIPETWGMENYAMLGTVAQNTVNQKIGSSIINIYSRSPSTIAMGAATIDTLSKGRLILGLGTSSIPIVEAFHGYKFERPIQRMKECIEIIKLVLSGKQVNYDGEIFNLKNFTLLIKPYRNSIPIYLAAINQKMVELTWAMADGAIFYLRPKAELKETISKMQKKKEIDVACQLITCVSDDSEKAIQRAKKTLSFYVAVGKVYGEFLAKTGFKNETESIIGEYRNSGLKSIHELVSDSMLKSLCIAGTPEEGKKQLQEFRETGIELPIIQFNPVGNTKDSFDLLKQTFFERS